MNLQGTALDCMTEEAGEHRGHLWQGEKILDSPACKGFLRIHLWMENNKNVLCIHVVQEILRPYYLRIYLWMEFPPAPHPPCQRCLFLDWLLFLPYIMSDASAFPLSPISECS